MQNNIELVQICADALPREANEDRDGYTGKDHCCETCDACFVEGPSTREETLQDPVEISRLYPASHSKRDPLQAAPNPGRWPFVP